MDFIEARELSFSQLNETIRRAGKECRICACQGQRFIAAGMSGKIKTVLQMALVMLLTVMSGNLLTDLVMLAAAAMTLYSMGEYVWQNRAVLGGAK